MENILENKWLLENLVGIVGVAVSIFIAYHILFLSRKISKKDKLEHKEKIKQKTEELLSRIYREGIRSKVYLVNIGRYFKDYPSNDEKLFSGYSHIRANVKSTRFNGIEFFTEIININIGVNGRMSLTGDNSNGILKAFAVGVVPYEWIEYVDLQGDEYEGVPLFYCHFKGSIYWNFWKSYLGFGYPYKKIIHYRESKNYHEGSDPEDMKYIQINQTIFKK